MQRSDHKQDPTTRVKRHCTSREPTRHARIVMTSLPTAEKQLAASADGRATAAYRYAPR